MTSPRRCLVLCLLGLLFMAPVDLRSGDRTRTPVTAPLLVTEFLPKGHATDGSVSYQAQLQQAIDTAARQARVLVFPPLTYRLNETGLQLRSDLTVQMHGAIFQLDEKCHQDGQAFSGKDIVNLSITGGIIIGRNEVWAEGVNIRGLYLTGAARNIRVRDLEIRNLSSNGMGIFGTAKAPARDVWVTDVVIENCCNRYGDYLSARVGPEKGSVREDQGLIALYHVQDFLVRGCRFEKSRSDGTHFYRCQRGQFVHNKVYGAVMGGYFIETCEEVLASDNIIRDNGSRGVTIERGSRDCTLKGNVVVNSGREGLWAPDCTGLVIVGNVFQYNGRKHNGLKAHQVWNSNITINEDPHDPTKAPTADYLVSGNIIYTSKNQTAAIRIDANATTSGIVVRDNLLRGENRRVLVEGEKRDEVSVQRNE